MKYKVLILQRGGKYSEEERNGHSAEIIVRGLMSWYGGGTRFIVTSEDGRTEKFIKTPSANGISGNTELKHIA